MTLGYLELTRANLGEVSKLLGYSGAENGLRQGLSGTKTLMLMLGFALLSANLHIKRVDTGLGAAVIQDVVATMLPSSN